MLELTEAATKQLDTYFEGKDKSQIRVYVSSGGCSGPGLALALDEAHDGDEVLTAGAYEFVIDKELLEQAKPIKIDLTYMGFSIESSIKFSAGGGGCSACGGGCGGGQ